MIKTFTTEAIVLRRVNYSDSDRILTLITPSGGKISAMARGVRKLKSKKAGHLDLGCVVKVFLARGRKINVLTQATTIYGNENIKIDLTLSKYLFESLEIVDKLTVEGQDLDFVYEDLLSFIKALKNTQSPREELFHFYRSLLINVGFWTTNVESRLPLLPEQRLNYLRSVAEFVISTPIKSRFI